MVLSWMLPFKQNKAGIFDFFFFTLPVKSIPVSGLTDFLLRKQPNPSYPGKKNTLYTTYEIEI